jgi:Tfp pilus assembly protein PilX
VHSALLLPHRASKRASERGVVLFTALILLLILTMVGVMLARSQSVEENISENYQDHQLAIQAAEATLRYAEVGLNSGLYTSFASDAAGQYQWAAGAPDWYQTLNMSSPAASFLPYAGSTALPVVAARFIVEKLPATTIPGNALPNGGYGTPTPVQVYRITAYSYGGDSDTTAELQEIDWQ